MTDQVDLAEEPSADAETAKPIRRAHCKSGTELAGHVDPEGLEGEGSPSTSQASSERDPVLGMFEATATSSASDDNATGGDTSGDACMQDCGERGSGGGTAGATSGVGGALAAPGTSKAAGGVGRCRSHSKKGKTGGVGIPKASKEPQDGVRIDTDAQILCGRQKGAKVQSDAAQRGIEGASGGVPQTARNGAQKGRKSKRRAAEVDTSTCKGDNSDTRPPEVALNADGQDAGSGGKRAGKRRRGEARPRACDAGVHEASEQADLGDRAVSDKVGKRAKHAGKQNAATQP